MCVFVCALSVGDRVHLRWHAIQPNPLERLDQVRRKLLQIQEIQIQSRVSDTSIYILFTYMVDKITK